MKQTETARAGVKKCLRCRKPFDSWDVTKNWICPSCSKANSREYIPRVRSSRIHGGDRGKESTDSEG